jgi:3-oxoacyl-[acyl-carrier-protein] synthase-3
MKYYTKINSIGAYYPDTSVKTSQLMKQLAIPSKPPLEALTGIKSRHFCSKDENSLTLAIDAIDSCLKHSSYSFKDIEMVINCSISKYAYGQKFWYEPSMSAMILKHYGNQKAIHLDISNACAGMMTGTWIANSYINQGIVKNCLVVSGEYISSIAHNAIKHIDNCRHNEFASLTVGDAGAALILEQTEIKSEGITHIDMQTFSQHADLCKGYQCEDSPGAYMQTEMREIHEESLNHSPEVIAQSLAKAGLSYKDINYVIPHQTAKRSIEKGSEILKKTLGGKPRIIQNLKNTGNTSSNTHFTTLYKYLLKGKFKETDRVLLISYASGLIIGTMVFTINQLRQNYGK